MARGIIYVMSTVVPGLVKIGKTGLDNFENRMYGLERNGYSNVVGLKRRFAIAVEDYDEKESLLGDIFSKSRVHNSELFALDINLVIQLLSSFDGEQVFPEPEKVSKDEVFDEAEQERSLSVGNNHQIVPDGTYYMSENRKGLGKVEGIMEVRDGFFIVKKGSVCSPVLFDNFRVPKALKNAKFVDNVLQEDIVCTSPSTAAIVVAKRPTNGWTSWKDENGVLIDEYRTGWSSWGRE